MTKKRKRFLVEFPDDVTDLIVAHPGGHIDLIEVDHGDQGDDDFDKDHQEAEETDLSDPEHEPAAPLRRKR